MSSTTPPPSQAQAPALPTKQGEIGYDEGQRDSTNAQSSASAEEVINAGPHPAERSRDRDSRPASTGRFSSRNLDGVIMPRPSNRPPSVAQSATPPQSITSSRSGKASAVFRSLRSQRPNRVFGGLSNVTVGRIILLLVTLGGVIGLWVFALRILRSEGDSSTNEPPPDSNSSVTSIMPSVVFVHVAFSFGVLILLVFFERVIYQARAERYVFLNPGSLPRFRHRRGLSNTSRMEGSTENAARRAGHGGLAFAPWNRPPLPTYAATMNYRGTGDVDDDIIAAPPPPAYGNTRGSTLLMLGVPALRDGEQPVPSSPPPPISRSNSWTANLRNYLAGARSGQAESTPRDPRTTSVSGAEPEKEGDAALSDDAARAMALSEALAKLEEGQRSPNPTQQS